MGRADAGASVDGLRDSDGGFAALTGIYVESARSQG
jgi:hypothetical protein